MAGGGYALSLRVPPSGDPLAMLPRSQSKGIVLVQDPSLSHSYPDEKKSGSFIVFCVPGLTLVEGCFISEKKNDKFKDVHSTHTSKSTSSFPCQGGGGVTTTTYLSSRPLNALLCVHYSIDLVPKRYPSGSPQSNQQHIDRSMNGQ